MTGQIIANGTEAFSPIVEKLGDIATEFLPYMIYIAITCLGVALAYKALNFITEYVRNKTRGVFNERVKYDRKRHNRDEKAGKLKPEREYYK